MIRVPCPVIANLHADASMFISGGIYGTAVEFSLVHGSTTFGAFSGLPAPCFPKVCGQLGKLRAFDHPQHRHDGEDVFVGRQEIPVWLRPAWGSRIALAGSDTALAGVLDHALVAGRNCV
ncbi:hypothetical protein EVAR_84353_1 [Eumeta japonica]|uniref:Uncharacterized protein n=1 Tax=Eumeta variegata TaxID=151549 RepID=A0A4C1U4P2_EUMVA|nr:hypothetical protein EVAR_84353_1 [Eumeta japonica]